MVSYLIPLMKPGNRPVRISSERKDTYHGEDNEPDTWHLYAYCKNNLVGDYNFGKEDKVL